MKFEHVILAIELAWTKKRKKKCTTHLANIYINAIPKHFVSIKDVTGVPFNDISFAFLSRPNLLPSSVPLIKHLPNLKSVSQTVQKMFKEQTDILLLKRKRMMMMTMITTNIYYNNPETKLMMKNC